MDNTEREDSAIVEMIINREYPTIIEAVIKNVDMTNERWASICLRCAMGFARMNHGEIDIADRIKNINDCQDALNLFIGIPHLKGYKNKYKDFKNWVKWIKNHRLSCPMPAPLTIINESQADEHLIEISLIIKNQKLIKEFYRGQSEMTYYKKHNLDIDKPLILLFTPLSWFNEYVRASALKII